MPAVRLMITSTSAERMRSTTSRYRFGSRLPRPVCGSRTWQCATVAPAFAASIAAAISFGVTGIAGCLPIARAGDGAGDDDFVVHAGCLA